MDDVIFAGAAKRPALGRAEVSLTIDNSAGLLPIDFTEVTITRTLFRSGRERVFAQQRAVPPARHPRAALRLRRRSSTARDRFAGSDRCRAQRSARRSALDHRRSRRACSSTASGARRRSAGSTATETNLTRIDRSAARGATPAPSARKPGRGGASPRRSRRRARGIPPLRQRPRDGVAATPSRRTRIAPRRDVHRDQRLAGGARPARRRSDGDRGPADRARRRRHRRRAHAIRSAPRTRPRPVGFADRAVARHREGSGGLRRPWRGGQPRGRVGSCRRRVGRRRTRSRRARARDRHAGHGKRPSSRTPGPASAANGPKASPCRRAGHPKCAASSARCAPAAERAEGEVARLRARRDGLANDLQRVDVQRETATP